MPIETKPRLDAIDAGRAPPSRKWLNRLPPVPWECSTTGQPSAGCSKMPRGMPITNGMRSATCGTGRPSSQTKPPPSLAYGMSPRWKFQAV